MTRRRVLGLALLAALAAAWLTRDLLLAGVGDLLVSEDAAERTDWVVLSGAEPGATSLEGVELYRAAVAKRILVVSWGETAVQTRIRALGIPQPTSSELIQAVLAKENVPSAAVTIVPGGVDGTESEIRVVADFARKEGVTSLLYVTTRTHTARARFLLKRRLRQSAQVLVRGSRFDPFTATTWWHDREQTRDVLAEYLRWMNSLLLSDLWRPQPT